MLQIVFAKKFFGNDRPSGIPLDTEPPDITKLINRVNTLNPSDYPFPTVKSILERENSRLGSGEKTIKSINSIDNNTVFIIGGQQAGLFGGPLYTLYKAMHIICLSLRLSDLTGRNVLPLFWVASDDHDFEEVKSIHIRTREGYNTKIEYSPKYYINNS